jgi:single-strand DNA-binding protein
MGSLNKVILIGNLGRDPEIRYTADGTPVANFSLATTDVTVDKSGNRQQNTEWHNIVAWRGLADTAKRFLSKGRQVYIEGKLRTREWNDKDGNKRRTTEVVASSLILLGARPESVRDAAAPAPIDNQAERPYPKSPQESEGFGDTGITDDDIPF